ncbi:MAG: hypothetical protein HN405_01550 [Planctomycetes bacterium]|nr:hypothetical protein [Planctomycetota bacterium]
MNIPSTRSPRWLFCCAAAFLSFALLTQSATAQGEHIKSNLLHEIWGVAGGEGVGTTTAVLGDLNADGYDDIAIGAPGAYSYAGAVYVYSGATGDLLLELTGVNYGDTFGASIAPLADINSDGFADIAVGAPNSANGYGEVYFISGYDGATLFQTHANGQTLDQYGFSIANVGDLDFDGFDEVLIGAHGTNANNGAAYVVSPANGTTMFTLLGAITEGYFGISVSGTGDANGDLTGDFVIGAYGANSFSGKAYLYSGSDASALHEFTGLNTEDYLGSAVAAAGDLNQDGYADLFIGAMGENDFAGVVYAHSGFDGSPIAEFRGWYAGDSLGSAIAMVGDADGDGVDDFLLGAPGYDQTRGAASLYSGATASLLDYYTGYSRGDYFGWSIAPAGDYDGRLHADFIIGAPGADSETGADSGYFQAWSLWSPILNPSSYEMSAAQGGFVFYGLDFPWEAGWGAYQLVVNLAGPGNTRWNGLDLPLKNDGLLQSTIAGDVPGPCLGFAGILDGYGDGMAAIWVPGGLPAGMVGTTYWLAAVGGQIGGVWDFGSWANPLTINP